MGTLSQVLDRVTSSLGYLRRRRIQFNEKEDPV